MKTYFKTYTLIINQFTLAMLQINAKEQTLHKFIFLKRAPFCLAKSLSLDLSSKNFKKMCNLSKCFKIVFVIKKYVQPCFLFNGSVLL